MNIDEIILGKRKEAPNCLEIKVSLDYLEESAEVVLQHLPDEAKERFQKEIKGYKTLKNARKDYKIQKLDIAPFYCRFGEILYENRENEVVSNHPELLEVAGKYEWAKNLVKDEGKKVHRFVDTSGANHAGKVYREEDTPANVHDRRCAVCSHSLVCQEIEADVLHHVTSERINKHSTKLAERRVKPVEEQGRKPALKSVKQHLLCFCYEFSCVNCPICLSSSSQHDSKTCTCEVCHCTCMARYPADKRDHIELELHPAVRDSITSSLLQRAHQVLPAESIKDGIIYVGNSLTNSQRQQLQNVVPAPTTLLSNGKDVRTIFPTKYHKSPPSSTLPCSSSSESNNLTLQSPPSQPNMMIPEATLTEIKQILMNKILNKNIPQEERSQSKAIWTKILENDSVTINQLNQLLSHQQDLTSEQLLEFLYL